MIREVLGRAANEFGMLPVCWAIQSDKTCTAFMALKDRKGISDFLAKKMKELRKGCSDERGAGLLFVWPRLAHNLK